MFTDSKILHRFFVKFDYWYTTIMLYFIIFILASGVAISFGIFGWFFYMVSSGKF